MLSYVPVNVLRAPAPPVLRHPAPRLAQVTPMPVPRAPGGLPPAVVNLVILTSGVGIGMLGFYHRKSPLGAIAMGAGGSVAGVGLVFFMLDLMGFGPAGL
jgi:hypothetical protein